MAEDAIRCFLESCIKEQLPLPQEKEIVIEKIKVTF